MSDKQRKAWFILALVVLTGSAWARRYEYAACDTDGCVAINRWSGSIEFREIEWSDEPEPERQVATAVGAGGANR